VLLLAETLVLPHDCPEEVIPGTEGDAEAEIEMTEAGEETAVDRERGDVEIATETATGIATGAVIESEVVTEIETATGTERKRVPPSPSPSPSPSPQHQNHVGEHQLQSEWPAKNGVKWRNLHGMCVRYLSANFRCV